MHASAQQAPSTTDVTPAPGAVSLAGVSKTFGDFTAVEALDLEVKPGEFLSMLGPSGSGKTTVLRMIAGFEKVTSGSIHLSGVDVTQVPPHARQVNTVFQDYALFPHFTIAENVGYGLRVAGVSRAERATQVGVALEQVRLSAVADRLPHQLSGTFIFVTHDQEEALTLSDRVAVFNNGRVEQVGTAREVYEFPATEFVAKFLGLSNLIPAELSADGVQSSVRPERVRLLTADTAASAGTVSLLGTVSETVYTGPTTRFLVDTESGVRVIAERANDHHPSAESAFARGDRVRVEWTTDHASQIG